MQKTALMILAATAATLITTGTAMAAGEDSVEVEIVKRATGGNDLPAIIFKAVEPVRNVVVEVAETGKEPVVYQKKALKAGETYRVAWSQEPGRAFYRVTYSWDGMKSPRSVSFPAFMAHPFDISVTARDIDLDAGRIGFSTSGKVAKVQVWLFALDGSELLRRELRMDLPSGPFKGLEYEKPDREIGLVKIVAFDPVEFTKELTFTPVSVPVPHDEVNFEFGSSEVRPSEEPKLEKVLAETDKALSKLGSQIRFKLFVAGYTDTVGSPESNLELSRRRAESISAWLRSHGMKLPVCSKGFGESVLAVETPDETRNDANRRTIFVISGQAPWGKDFPGNGDWNCR